MTAPKASSVEVGSRVRCWPGLRAQGRTYEATVLMAPAMMPNFTSAEPMVRVSKDEGGTDYLKLSHVEVLA